MRYFFLICLVLSWSLTAVAADTAVQNTAPQSPEDAVQALMLGMLKGDSDAIKAVVLPTDEVEVLWQGGTPPKEIYDQIEKSIRAAKYTRVKEGEKIQLPSGKEIVIDKEMIGDKKVMLWIEMDGQRMPMPFATEQKDWGWKVDAKPLIAARKAAKAMQQGNQ